MIRYERRERVVEPRWEEVERICDLCQRPMRHAHESHWDASDVTIRARVGGVYPEGDFRKCHEADVCATCWNVTVRPALEAIGVVFHEYDNEDGRRRSELEAMGVPYGERR